MVGGDGIANATAILPHMLEICQNVWERTEALYTKEDLHSLP